VFRVSGLQGQSQSPLGEVSQMDGEMTPEGAIVVPQMVVGVTGPATNGQFCFGIHRCVLSAGAHAPGGLKTKMPSEKITTASRFSERIFSGTNGVPHICPPLARLAKHLSFSG
jgi:hypothetical protein